MRSIPLSALSVALGFAFFLSGCLVEGSSGDEDVQLVEAGASFVTSTTDSDPMHVAALMNATGGYRFTGYSTFEPTIGTTASGALFTDSYRGTVIGGSGGGALILRSVDQGGTWQDVTPVLPTGMKLVPNSNDPYIFVDPFTDRLYDFDMCVTATGFCLAVSDDEGDTWSGQNVVTGWSGVNDHQSLASVPVGGPDPLASEDVSLVFCVNKVLSTIGSWCSSSFDGGATWTPQVPGYPTGTAQCSGIHAHLEGSVDGFVYRAAPGCNGPVAYRSDDAGLSWTQHEIATADDRLRSGDHEVALATDEAGNVYAFWIAHDGLPYLAVSADHAETWSEPRPVAAAGVTAAGFPSIAAGAEGRVAWTYIATDVPDGYQGSPADMEWTGYIGISLDALHDDAFANVPINEPDDPLDAGHPCGNQRCGGFGDFVDITIDAEGRPWAALAHNGEDEAGIVGTLTAGPSLRGAAVLAPLDES